MQWDGPQCAAGSSPLRSCGLQQQPWIHLDNETRTYLPTVFFNDFWTLRDYMVPVNETVSQLQLQLNLNSVGPWKWMMYLQMEQSFSMQVRLCTGGLACRQARPGAAAANRCPRVC